MTRTDPTPALALEPVPAGRSAAVTIGTTTLLMAIPGIASNAIVLGMPAVDAAATLVVDPLPLQLAILGFATVAVLDIVLAWALVRYFGRAHGGLAILAAWLRIAYAAVLVAATGHLLAATQRSPDHAATADDVDFALATFSATWQVGLLVFAAHLAVLALILVHERGTPTVLGILIALAAAGYVIDGVVRLLLPSEGAILAVVPYVVAIPSVVGEFSFGLWFLLRGGRRP